MEKKVVVIFKGKKWDFIADRQTKVVKLVTSDSAYECYMAWLNILISPYLIPLSLWIQITIDPLSIDGAIVIFVYVVYEVAVDLWSNTIPMEYLFAHI